MSLTRESILSADDLQREEVEVPEWGGSVWVRMMTAPQRVALSEAAENTNGSPKVTWLARLVAETLCDETGNLLFSADDLPALDGKDYAAMQRVCQAAQRINGMTADAQKETEKNSVGEEA